MHWSFFTSWPKTDDLLNISLQSKFTKNALLHRVLHLQPDFGLFISVKLLTLRPPGEEGADDGRDVRACSSRCCHGNWGSHSGCSRCSARTMQSRLSKTTPGKVTSETPHFAFWALAKAQLQIMSLVHKTSRSCQPPENWSSSLSQAFRPRQQSKDHSETHKYIRAIMQETLLASQIARVW